MLDSAFILYFPSLLSSAPILQCLYPSSLNLVSSDAKEAEAAEEVEAEEEEAAAAAVSRADLVRSRVALARARAGQSIPALRVRSQVRIVEEPPSPLLYPLASSSQGG